MRYAIDWRKNIRMQYYKIEITDLAAQDLEQHGDYIAFVLKNPSAAKNTVKGIRTAINQLQTSPKKHELDEDEKLAELGIRKCYYKNYKIYYIVDEVQKSVIVVRILHMLVDSKQWMYRTFDL